MLDIIAIGGGSYEKGETEKIDRLLLEKCRAKSGNARPRMIYFSTASVNEPQGSQTAAVYFTQVGFDVECISLILDFYTPDELRDKLKRCDTVYIGGGDTIRLVHTLRSLTVDKMLYEAAQNGVILAGISAGASCFFEYAHTNSLEYYIPDPPFIRFGAFGFIKGVCSPHYGTKRKADLRTRIADGKEDIPIFGLENGVAVEYLNGEYFAIFAKEARRAHIYLPDGTGKFRIFRPRELEAFGISDTPGTSA